MGRSPLHWTSTYYSRHTNSFNFYIINYFLFIGDEVVVIQGKLDGIKAKYAEINSLSDNVLKTLERVLSLSSKLQHTHEDLSSWLEKVEAEISAFADQEPVGEQLIHAQSRQKVSDCEIKVCIHC